MVFMNKLTRKIAVFLEMIKFEHSIFALPFAYLGLILAEGGWPRLHLFVWVTVAMVSFRTMGMALNRLIDQNIDTDNPRTRERALPARKLNRGFVWSATIFSFLIFEWSAYLLNPLCFLLSPIPVFLAFLYPWTKRFTWFSHLVLGMILGIAPYGAWVASRGEFSWIPGFLTVGIATWVCGFDIIYALQDEAFDKKRGLFSFPARFGFETSLIATRFLHVFTLAAWVAVGIVAQLGIAYYLGLVVVMFFLLREHWLIRSFGLQKIGESFFTMNAVVSVAVFLAVVIDTLCGSLVV